MRKRIALCMVALVLTLLGPGMALVVSRSFALTMERERARALGEEAAIARALTLETAEGNVGRSTASTLQTRYGSNELTIYLLQNGETITGKALPTVQKLPELLNTETRATLLDGVSERLLIAHALDGEITLLTALDVSPVYALRRELLRGAAALGLIGLALAGALAIWISGVLTRPLSQLADAAAKLADMSGTLVGQVQSLEHEVDALVHDLMDQRRHPRKQADVMVTVDFADGAQSSLRLHDVSRSGMRLAKADGVRTGTEGRVYHPVLGPLDVKVVWCNEQVMGAQLIDRMLSDEEVDQLVTRRLAA